MQAIPRSSSHTETSLGKRQHKRDRKFSDACGYSGRLEEAHSALSSRANPNRRDEFGLTALIHAATNGRIDSVKYLIEKTTAQVNTTDNDSWTACHYAARYGHLEVVKLLVAHGANRQLRNNYGMTPLEVAKEWDKQSVEEYLMNVDCNEKLLLSACRCGTLVDVQSALSNGANPNWTDEKGNTALMTAASNGHTKIVKYLVEETTVQINATNNDLWTACHYATRNGHLKVVKLLVAHGANRQLREKGGRTPLELAKLFSCQSVVHYLVKLEAPTYTKLVQRAMRDGTTRVLIIKALVIGPPGVGKTGIRCLLLGLPPPPKRTSTPLATRATRAISFYRLKTDGSGDVTWTELDDDTYLKYIAEEVKMLELNPSRAVPSQPAISIAPVTIGSSAEQKPSDTPPQSPATPLASSVSPEEIVENANPSVLPKKEGTVFNVACKIVTDPEPSKEPKKKKTFVHLIDSGGQPSFVSLVPAFVRGSTVNIVASKLNYSINDKLQYEYVKDDQHLRQPTKLEKSQLESIEELVRTLSTVKHSENRGSSEPKFLLVGTHADKHWSLFQETLSGKNRWLKKCLGELRSMCIEVSPDGDILLPINTRVTKGRNEVASSIRQKIMNACSGAGVDIPTRWYVFELEVSGKANKESRGVLGLAECMDVGEKLDMGGEDVMAALVFLDGAALCLYFQDAAPHLVFTDPQAILSEVTEILNLGIIDLHFIPSLYPLLSEYMALVRRLRDQGLFNKKLIEIVCSKYRVNKEGKCSYSVDDFLAILQHLLIVACVCIDEEELFFIPSILPTSKQISPLSGELDPLVIVCRTRVIPIGMFSALVVALLCNKLLFALDKILGCNAVSLECKLGGVILLVECHAWLTVHFNGNPSVAVRIRAAIHNAIAIVCEQRHLDTKQVVFTDGFFCPFKSCESIPHPCVVNIATHWLTCSVRPKVASCRCNNERMLAWLPALDDTIPVTPVPATPLSFPPTTPLALATPPQSSCPTATVSASTTTPSTPPTDTETVSQFQFLEAVASKIPAKWRRVGLSLEISSSVLDGIEKHRRGDCLECFSDVYACWQQQSTPQSPANWATLVTVLQSNYVGEEELSDTVRNMFI